MMHSISSFFSPTTLFNLHTGAITPKFKRDLAKCGIVFDSDNIVVVDKVLQARCYQKNPHFYKEGKTSQLKLTYEQAVSFLNEECRDLKNILPSDRGLCDAIVECGDEPPMVN